MPSDLRKFSPAVKKNQRFILETLKLVFPSKGQVLEIASGTGEHASFFAPALGDIHWQPSEYDIENLASIDAHAAMTEAHSVRPAIHLDVTMDPWPIDQVDAVFNSNMVHISPWFVTESLMKGVGQKLKSGGVMAMYGPYIRKGFPTAPSNEAFDQSLRSRNKQWGIRDLDDVIASAKANGLLFDNLVEMPANNYCVIYKKL